jgi:hypothetical protein
MSFLNLELTPFSEGLLLFRVTAPQWKHHLLERVYALCNVDPRVNFPAPLPLSLERAHFPTVKQSPYWVCEKTDGVRCLLLVCKLDGVKIVLMMDRNKEFYHIRMRHVPRALFEDTILDGELVLSNGRWHYLIFDAMAISGLPMFNRCLSTRLRCARLATKTYGLDEFDTLVLVHKNFYRTMPEFDARDEKGMMVTDGIILTPENDPIVAGRRGAVFKWKPHHTMDFKVKIEPGNKASLLVYDNAKKDHVAVARLAKVPVDVVDGDIIEAGMGKRSWEFQKRRHDKDRCNDKLTFDKTKLNIKENIQYQEIYMLL